MTYGESAQLTSAALLPDSDDLRQLAGNTKGTSTSLKKTHGLHVDDVGVEERVSSSSQTSNENSGSSTLTAVLQDQGCDSDVLDGDEGRLTVCAKGEAHASIVGERDEV
jgi:hypothetical protein